MPDDMQEKAEKAKGSPFYRPYSEDRMMRGPEDWYRCTNEYIKMPERHSREMRAYFATHQVGEWLNQPAQLKEDSFSRFRALYGDAALELAKTLGIMPENADPVQVGGTLVGPKGKQQHSFRPVYKGVPVKMADVISVATDHESRLAALEEKLG